MKYAVVPFAVPQNGVIEHKGWSIRAEGSTTALPKEIAIWDYQSELDLVCGIGIDRLTLSKQCGLAMDSELSILVVASSTGTIIQQVVANEPVPLRDKYEMPVDVRIAGRAIGGRLQLDTLLVASRPVPLTDLAARQPGSILWRTRHSVFLEGNSGQFPTDAEDFAITRPQYAKAGWVLEVDCTDLEAMFVSAVRLTVNSGSEPIRQLLAGTSSDETKLLARSLDVDVTRQLVGFALRDDDVVHRSHEPESTSLGGVLRGLLAQLWPHTSPVTLRGWMIDEPSRLDARIQSARGYMR